MSIRPEHFRDFVVKPTLAYLAQETLNPNMDTPEAIELIMGTVAHESHMGHYLRQHPTGPARGIGQMERATYYDLWESYLKHRPSLADAVRGTASNKSIDKQTNIPDFAEVVTNLFFCVAMIRVRYLPAPAKIPPAHDLKGQADYHVKYYNRGGAAKAEAYMADYRKYVLRLV